MQIIVYKPHAQLDRNLAIWGDTRTPNGVKTHSHSIAQGALLVKEQAQIWDGYISGYSCIAKCVLFVCS